MLFLIKKNILYIAQEAAKRTGKKVRANLIIKCIIFNWLKISFSKSIL
jgi:hypothetical protein